METVCCVISIEKRLETQDFKQTNIITRFKYRNKKKTVSQYKYQVSNNRIKLLVQQLTRMCHTTRISYQIKVISFTVFAYSQSNLEVLEIV